MKYLPALDGLRAVAVLAVVCVHAGAPFATGGFVGVDVFFVLSGYLITRVLAEHRPTLREFYIRRARRLMPALLAFLGVYVAVGMAWHPGYDHAQDAMIAAMYLSDYSHAYWYVPRYIPHLWSLSVEEHFYLLWPLVFYRFRPSWRVLLVAYLAGTAWHWWPGQVEAYFRFDTHCTGLILGCLIAQAPRLNLPAWPGLVLLAMIGAIPHGPDAWSQGPLLVEAELAAAYVILARAPAWMESDLLTYIGKLSYGIYLWHYPISRLTLGLDWTQALAASLVGSVTMAALSYHTIEALARRREHVRALRVVDVELASGRTD